MLTILSPAKRINVKEGLVTHLYTIPMDLDKSEQLIKKLRKFKATELEKLFNISSQLAEENVVRYKQWSLPFSTENAKQAIMVFNGEVYYGIQAKTLNKEDLAFAQNQVRIISGLHGLLLPLDLIQPYRLEMGSKIGIGKYKSLYEFWGDSIRNRLEHELKGHKHQVLINLASQEYAKAAQTDAINVRVITPVFKELKGDEYKVVTVYAKRARGLMTRFIIKNRIDDPEALKLFEEGGYFYNDNLSTKDEWVFTR